MTESLQTALDAKRATDQARHLRLLRLKETLAKTGLSKSGLYVAIEKHGFPRAVPLLPGSRAVGWPEHLVDSWLAARIAAEAK
jgi:prophage regulatory protein